MAAEAVKQKRKTRLVGKVETRGSVGPAIPSPGELAEADLVIVAADIEVDLNSEVCWSPRACRTSTGWR